MAIIGGHRGVSFSMDPRTSMKTASQQVVPIFCIENLKSDLFYSKLSSK
jgi:hypothetical protein